MSLKPLILELDDAISDKEEMVGVKTIGIPDNGHVLVGYVAVIIEKEKRSNIRYANLKAIPYINEKMGKTVI